MEISPKTKRNIGRVIPFGVIWLLVGWFILFIQEVASGSQNVDSNAVISLTSKVFVFASISVALLGLLVGYVEIFWLNKVFGNRSLAKEIAAKVGFYILFFLVVMLLLYPIAASIELEVSPFHTRVWEKFGNWVVSMDFYSTMGSLLFSLFLSLFYSEISENLGYGVLTNFFTGKYHKPVEEKRIFMFLDMKSSTTIAENLGHIAYFELLKTYYADFSDAIINNYGEVYQYIGDEIVISWAYEDGIRNNNCLRCFFDMKDSLARKADGYQKEFGVTPTFKAGLHYGKVTTGEIGALKKEIIFTGDVLNTTARIQALCSMYKVDELISKALMGKLNLPPKYHTEALGSTPLRGREETVELVTISRAN